MSATTQSNHGGLLIPLDPIRISQMAALCAELLVSKARNILDAKLIVSRPLESPILLVRIEGHVVGDDAAAFWRENADIAAMLSQALPRQVFMYYAEPGPHETRREGFLVAQRGQVLAADDATADRIPEGSPENEWPVSRLCEQLRLNVDDLAAGFPEGPRVEVPLAEPNSVDDQALLMTLAGQPPEEDEEGGPAPGGGPAPASKAKVSVDDDVKRRAKEQAEEEAAQAQRAQQVRSELPYTEDELGIVVAPKAELGEPDILAPFIVTEVRGDLPTGVPPQMVDKLQGRRIDIAVPVEFLSEVFLGNNPLNRKELEEHAEETTLAGQKVRVIEVLAPRLGYGTLVSTGKKHVYVSRRLGQPLPGDFVLSRLEA